MAEQGSGLAMAGMMGAGMISQGFFGYLANKDSANAMQTIAGTQANAQVSIANSQANAQISIANTQANAEKRITQINADAAVQMTRERYEAMIFMAQEQYRETRLQLDYADRADRRQAMIWMRELNSRSDVKTVEVNANLVATNQQHTENMTQMKLDHDEKVKELKGSDGRPIDVSSLFS